MNRYIFILILTLCFALFGHSQTNPFEIENRIISPSADLKSGNQSTANSNPFEISASTASNTHKSSAIVGNNSREGVEDQANELTSDNIPLVVFGISLILIAVAVNISRSMFPMLFTALINENKTRILYRELSKWSVFSFSLYAIFILNLALLLCYLAQFQFVLNIWPYYFWLLLGIVFIYLMRHIIMRVLSNVFPFDTQMKLYDFNIIHVHVALGVLLFVSNLLHAYTNTGPLFLWIGLGLWMVFVIHRVFRGISSGLRYRQINLFHFFMYICAFELAPNISLLHFAKFSFLGS